MSHYEGEIRGSKLPYETFKAQYINVVDESARFNSWSHPLDGSGDYTYRRWLKGQPNLKGSRKTYDTAISFDVEKLIKSMSSEDETDFINNTARFRRSVEEVIQNRAHAYSYTYDVDIQLVLEVLNSHYSNFLIDASYSALEDTYSYGGRRSWLRQLLTDKFSANYTNNPRATWINAYKSIVNGTVENGFYDSTAIHTILRNQIQYQLYPKQWETLPIRYIMLPMVSDNFIRYMLQGNGTELDYSSLYYKSATAKSWFSAKRAYWYAPTQSGMRFDNYSGNWLAKSAFRNRRKYQSCDLCHIEYDVMMLDWYKIRSYQNNRSRICYQCIAIRGLSYNPWQKAWVIASYNSQQDVDDAANDRPVRMVHIDDTDEKPVGKRDYDWRTDVDFLEENNIDVPVEQLKLPVETRRYLTWLKRLPQGVRMNIGFTLTTLRTSEIANAVYGTGGGRNTWIAEHQVVLNSFPAQYRQEVNGNFIAMWIDSHLDNRDFLMRYTRTARTPESRVTNDGWVEPNHGLVNMNKEKNSYNYRPDFYYVDYIDGKYYSTYTDGSSGDYLYCADHDQPNHRCTSWHREYGLFMGLELELIARDKRDMSLVGPQQLFERTLETFHPNGYREMSHDVSPQLMYIKRDGSLPERTGAEFISQPMSMRAWQNVPKTFWYMTEGNYKAYSVGGVGIHIHIPWDAFTEVHGYTFLSALQALQRNNNGLLKLVAQRPSNTWTAWDELEYNDVPNAIAAVVQSRRAQNSSKYQGINLLHSNTIELRYFNSNAKGGRVLKNLEFVKALYDFTMWLSDSSGWDSELGPDEFLLRKINAWYQKSRDLCTWERDIIHCDKDREFSGALNIEQQFVNFVKDNEHLYGHLWSFFQGLDDDLEISDSEINSLWETEETIEDVEEVEEEVVDDRPQPTVRIDNTI